jgi:hypothetical protein
VAVAMLIFAEPFATSCTGQQLRNKALREAIAARTPSRPYSTQSIISAFDHGIYIAVTVIGSGKAQQFNLTGSYCRTLVGPASINALRRMPLE